MPRLVAPLVLSLYLAALASLPGVMRSTPDLTVHIVAAQDQQQRCFPETGHCINGRIREYWEQNGGLLVFGYPITARRTETVESQTLTVQWFERARIELHPDFNEPYDVLLGRVGAERLLQLGRTWQSESEVERQKDCLWFEQTHHNLCNQGQVAGFKRYWEQHQLRSSQLDSSRGSLALFGLPLTEAYLEATGDGEQRIVQWFERSRFEWHPDYPDQFKVLPGLLGNEILGDRQ